MPYPVSLLTTPAVPCRLTHYLEPSITASTCWPSPSTMPGEQACGCQAPTWPTSQRTQPSTASTRRSWWILVVMSKPITSSWTLTTGGTNFTRPIWWTLHPECLVLLGGPSVSQEDPLLRLITAAGSIRLMSAQEVRGFDQASVYIHLSVNMDAQRFEWMCLYPHYQHHLVTCCHPQVWRSPTS